MTCWEFSRRAAALALAAALASPAAAQTLTRQQRNAANHVAQVMAIELECPEFAASGYNVAVLLGGYKLDLGQAPLAGQFPEMVREHRAGLRAAGNKVGCMVGWGLYGPGGQNVPDLLRKK